LKKYEILLSRTAEKQLRTIPKRDRERIVEAIQSLSIQPYPAGCRKLFGEEAVFRIRVGDYRVIYEVESNKLLILVFKIGHRKEIYR